MITLYGIPNCTTMKKAFAWCDEHGVAYAFHDYRKQGVDPERLTQWCKHAGWRTLVNNRGTTWRKLTPEQQDIASNADAVALMLQFPSVIRRPVVETGSQLLVGFDPQLFASFVK
jgi:arsenate reductase